MSTSPYKRRRPRVLRNLWIYRRLVLLAFLVGLVFWFILVNKTRVEVAFPFGLGTISSSTGVLILASAFCGSAATFLATTIARALKRDQAALDRSEPAAAANRQDEELPPADYAAKTTEGFSPVRWK